MRNPLARLVRHDPAKPNLRERAASLRASAARVIRRPKPVASASSPVDPIAIPDGIVSDDGMVSFVDAAGTMRRTSVADWIGFAAVRLNGIALRHRPRSLSAGSHPMKLRLSMRAALAFGYSDIARGLGRLHRWQRGLLTRAGHEAGRGNVVTAAVLVAVYVVAL